MRSATTSGFVLPAVIVLLALAALLVADAVRGAAMTQSLASAAQLRLRTAEAADGALAQVQGTLAAQRNPPAIAERISQPGVTTHTRVRLELIETLTPGYSVNRVTAQRFRARSVSHGGRGAQLAIEAGYTRLVPAP